MNIEIYYQKWDEKKKNSHELLERAVRQYAREKDLVLPEQLELAAVAQKEKPYFQNAKEIQFSISHSGDWWACAISREAVGLDIQQEQECRADRLARRFFHPLEVAWLEQNGYSHFCEVWAYKESYVKYTGVGLVQGMDYFSVINPAGVLSGVEDVCQQFVAFHRDCHMVVTTKHRWDFSLRELID